ncbi:hypothetical protein [uncultured Methanoregula sp.]|uniref:hypothetical protein n=1 Tax=uncultured Methanoregula sp. TaxID=1005933 RepID=UPI002AAA93D3|nr:hypothetical protein [uncultured Methanoregula sp.]
MINIDWGLIGLRVVSMVVTFVIITIIAHIMIWLVDIALSEVDFTTMQKDPMAKSIGSLGWLILYSLAFAGSLIGPFSLDNLIYTQLVWTVTMIVVASVLTVILVKVFTPLMPYCGKEGLKAVGDNPVSTSIFYLGLCILMGTMSYVSLVATY